MSRKSEFQTSNPNPATKFIEWKSDLKTFSFYDKEKSENVVLKLPFKFLTLMELHTVKGWNDASESGIYSNEVKYIGTEELTIKSFKGGLIAKGNYKDIKQKIQNAGGYYSKSVYAMLKNGDIVNFQLKGSAVKEWGDFTQKTRSRLSDEWVEVTGANELKKGKISYTTPIFKFNTSLNKKENDLADVAYDTLKEYMKSYVKADNTPAPAVEDVNNDLIEQPNDIPF